MLGCLMLGLIIRNKDYGVCGRGTERVSFQDHPSKSRTRPLRSWRGRVRGAAPRSAQPRRATLASLQPWGSAGKEPRAVKNRGDSAEGPPGTCPRETGLRTAGINGATNPTEVPAPCKGSFLPPFSPDRAAAARASARGQRACSPTVIPPPRALPLAALAARMGGGESGPRAASGARPPCLPPCLPPCRPACPPAPARPAPAPATGVGVRQPSGWERGAVLLPFPSVSLPPLRDFAGNLALPSQEKFSLSPADLVSVS